jgi:hypothetical protein
MRFNKHKYRHLDTDIYDVKVPYHYVYVYSSNYCAYINSNRNNRKKHLISNRNNRTIDLMKCIVGHTNHSIKTLNKHYYE